MEIRLDTKIDKGKTYWYDFNIESYEKLNKIVLYLTTMSNHFTINVKKLDNNKYIGYIITEIQISEEIIEKWYDEIKTGTWEGGE